MLLDKLKDYFGENFVTNEKHNTNNHHYYWFKTPDNEVIGFPKDKIRHNELDLLNIFLKPIDDKITYSPQTEEEKKWASLLFTDADVELPNQTSFRFIYFLLKEELQERDTFNEAIKSLFPGKTLILWETETTGVFIDFEPKTTDMLDNFFESIVDTVISDFFVEIFLYLGSSNITTDDARTTYQWEKGSFRTIQKQVKKQVYKGEEELPFLLFDEATRDTLLKLRDQTLQRVVDDRDLIQSIKVYLDCNMNVSLAAKKLYLHRNTLQYRVDKFIEKTGIDIRHFRSAVSVYIALLIEKNIH
ncbi:helix-turn-helix domain-containing protein [Alkalihalobacillus sp. MEB130]|uniref:PucR family transcriptional regulator n=1 Tax=Alkalihalobacillus sp. MEB130 TaxID=2976704 RepID=UPI0028E09576|nr:helix-turn-helix domain-containing protein [Alkalihalobacillus sp. MEB130]MDT8859224.1 helix-turn-helix domain-containing protein [Alkalihalobacillus sp. MEB130]